MWGQEEGLSECQDDTGEIALTEVYGRMAEFMAEWAAATPSTSSPHSQGEGWCIWSG